MITKTRMATPHVEVNDYTTEDVFTAGELIEILSKVDPNTYVFVHRDPGGESTGDYIGMIKTRVNDLVKCKDKIEIILDSEMED